MKTFKFTVPEPGSYELPHWIRMSGIYFNAAVCLTLVVPYFGLCMASIAAYGGFYILGVLWLFFVSPVFLFFQLVFFAKSLKSGNLKWKSHGLAILLSGAAYLIFAAGLFGKDCAISV